MGEILQKGKVCSSISEIKSTIRKRKIKLKKSVFTFRRLKNLDKKLNNSKNHWINILKGNKSIGQQVNIELKKDNENLTKHLEKFKVENSKLKIKFKNQKKYSKYCSKNWRKNTIKKLQVCIWDNKVKYMKRYLQVCSQVYETITGALFWSDVT